MRALVTGAAGFIGSALSRCLLERGDYVRGIDSFLDSYPRPIKDDRLINLQQYDKFEFFEADLVDVSLDELVEDIDCIFHLAAQAGVRSSWGQRFEVYTQCNILATQRLLEVVKDRPIERFVYSSSSSVYGNAEIIPTPEGAPLNPVSPYAVSKLAGEHLCSLYHRNYGVPTTVLRYFTVYGPKPRPDMAVCIFTRALLEGREIEIFGDGRQLRGMTYVDDVVRANLLATVKDCVGEVFNIGGGSSITMNELIRQLEIMTDVQARINYGVMAKGDARNTQAEITRAQRVLGWNPEVDTQVGLERAVASIKEFYGSGAN